MNVLLKATRVLLFILVGLVIAVMLSRLVSHGSVWTSHGYNWGYIHEKPDSLEGSAHRSTQTRPLEAFDSIELNSSGDLDITIAPTQQLSLEAPDNLLDSITTQVHGHTLVIDADREYHSHSSPKFTITLPKLTDVNVNGSGRVRIHGLDGDDFSLHSEGAGDFTLDGKLRTLDIDIEGAGRVDAHALNAANVVVQVAGAGYARVRASESLDATIGGIGRISYSGNPAHIEKHVGGIGVIKPEDSSDKPEA